MVGEGVRHHSDEVVPRFVLVGVVGDEDVFGVVEIELQFVDIE